MKKHKKASHFGMFLTLFLAAGYPSLAFALSEYAITGLGTLGTQSIATDINTSGQVVGDAVTFDGNLHAFLWQQATGMIDLGTLPGDNESGAFSINDTGQITGFSQGAPEVQSSGFLWQSGTGMINIGAGTGLSVNPVQINQSGQVVGTSNISGFIYSTATGLTQATVPGTQVESVFAYNDHGQMVFPEPNNGHNDLFYSPGQSPITIDAGPHWATNEGIVSMNESGTVAGTMVAYGAIQPNQSQTQHAFLWTAAAGLTDLTPGLNDAGSATGINNLDQVVGWALQNDGLTFPFLYENGTMYNLSDSLGIAGDGWTNLIPQAINDNGQIVGSGTFDGQIEAFLLTPTGTSPNVATPEPASASLLLLGITLLLRRNRREGEM